MADSQRVAPVAAAAPSATAEVAPATRASLTARIKDYALDIGYSRVGVATVEDFDAYGEILTAAGELYDWWVDSPRHPLEWMSPRTEVPEAKAIVVLVYDYAQHAFPPALCELAGRVYLSRSYLPPATNLNGTRLELMQRFLGELGIGCQPGTWLLPERWAAVRAGVASFGENTCIHADGIGSFIVVSTLLVDLELEPDEPAPANDCPTDCHRCLDACPTGALYEPFKLNPRRCIAFNGWMTAKGRGHGITDSIPHDIRPLMGTRIHGCDRCQEVCPRNHRKLTDTLPPDEFLLHIAPDLTLQNFLHLPEGFYETRVKPIMYNYIRDLYLFQRNAAVAIGNTHDAQYVPDLVEELDNEHEAVRGHVAWALGQIGGACARDALVARLAIEGALEVRAEIEAALGQPAF